MTPDSLLTRAPRVTPSWRVVRGEEYDSTLSGLRRGTCFGSCPQLNIQRDRTIRLPLQWWSLEGRCGPSFGKTIRHRAEASKSLRLNILTLVKCSSNTYVYLNNTSVPTFDCRNDYRHFNWPHCMTGLIQKNLKYFNCRSERYILLLRHNEKIFVCGCVTAVVTERLRQF